MQRLIIPRRFVTTETIEATKIQQTIDELRSFVLNQYMDVTDESTINPDWLQQTIDLFHNGDSAAAQKTTFADAVPDYVNAHNIFDGTQRQYAVLQRMLVRFGQCVRPLYIDEIESRDIDDFVAFLRREIVPTKNQPSRLVERSQNTINGKLKRFRAVSRWLYATGRAQTDPFAKYKIPNDVYGDPIFLTLDERDAIYATRFNNPALERQKDVFILQCLIGCRVSDLLTLTTANVTDDGFIQYIQHKLRKNNPEVIRVPLTDTAKEIIAKYAGQPDGRLLPFISSQRYNDEIKRVLRIAGINRVVMVQNKLTYESEPKQICDIAASHLARRTFMANLYKETKSERIVSSFTGHADGSTAFRRYTTIDDEMKRDVIARIDANRQKKQ